MGTTTDNLLTVIAMQGGEAYVARLGQIAQGLDTVSKEEQHADAARRKAIEGINALSSAYSAQAGRMTQHAMYAGVVSAGFLGIAGAAVKAAASMEQAHIALNTLTGSAAAGDKLFKELRQFALTTPFEFKDMPPMAQRMMAMGTPQTEVIGAMRTLGDVAAAMGGGAEMINRVTLALGQMRNSVKVNAQDMNQLTQAGIPAWKMLANAMHMSIAELKAMNEAPGAVGVPGEKAYALLMAEMSAKYGGAMAAQMATAAGKLSNLKDAMNDLAVAAGNELLPMLKDMTASATAIVSAFAGAPQSVKAVGAVGTVLVGVSAGIYGVVAASKAWELQQRVNTMQTALLNAELQRLGLNQRGVAVATAQTTAAMRAQEAAALASGRAWALPAHLPGGGLRPVPEAGSPGFWRQPLPMGGGMGTAMGIAGGAMAGGMLGMMTGGYTANLGVGAGSAAWAGEVLGGAAIGGLMSGGNPIGVLAGALTALAATALKATQSLDEMSKKATEGMTQAATRFPYIQISPSELQNPVIRAIARRIGTPVEQLTPAQRAYMESGDYSHQLQRGGVIAPSGAWPTSWERAQNIEPNLPKPPIGYKGAYRDWLLEQYASMSPMGPPAQMPGLNIPGKAEDIKALSDLTESYKGLADSETFYVQAIDAEIAKRRELLKGMEEDVKLKGDQAAQIEYNTQKQAIQNLGLEKGKFAQREMAKAEAERVEILGRLAKAFNEMQGGATGYLGVLKSLGVEAMDPLMQQANIYMKQQGRRQMDIEEVEGRAGSSAWYAGMQMQIEADKARIGPGAAYTKGVPGWSPERIVKPWQTANAVQAYRAYIDATVWVQVGMGGWARGQVVDAQATARHDAYMGVGGG